MCEFIPEPCHINSNAQFDHSDYASRNGHHQCSTVITDFEASSDRTMHGEPANLSPTYTLDTKFSSPDAVDDDNFSRFGYSTIFQMGLRAQSSPNTQPPDALIEKAFAKLRVLWQRLARR
ncbi:hypothetical protein PYCCODRAFT_1468793 [Trametes coccinea BRFM310]|uniref:Uncharacterized protein n=1 Tax=Trametes coccinea (strain BRFM310) TaxID=1353009 RepID=A0A1Y2IIY1_TRAC3|nr:hypothetical protein PYCCODRAFT_1468793 [Trametes coccinea BRFM310]